MAKYRVDYLDWKWGRLQWGHEIEFLVESAEAELAKLKTDYPDVDFVKLAEDVRAGKVKPV